MKKKILISIGCISAVVAPIATAVSCGTSWQHWNKRTDQDTSKKQDPTKTNIPSVDPNAPKPVEPDNTGPVVIQDSLWKVRDIADIRAAALDQATNTIDLDKVNNQFELNVLLIDLLGLKSSKTLEAYWERASWPEFETYVNGIKDTVSIKIKYKNLSEQTINWDITKAKQEIIKGLSSGKDSFVKIEEDKHLYVEPDGKSLSRAGFEVAKNAAVNLMNLKIVKSLTTVDIDYAAYKLAMLVNLPIPSFQAFQSLLRVVGNFTDKLFGVNNHQFKNELINQWVADKQLNARLKISDLKSLSKYPDGLIEGAFILQAVSLEYDNLK